MCEIDEQIDIVDHSENKIHKMIGVENIDMNNLQLESCDKSYENDHDNWMIWKEECNSFGQYIANKLSQYDLRTRAFVEHAMSHIIFEADIGKFTNDPSSSNSEDLFLSYANFEHAWLKRNNGEVK